MTFGVFSYLATMVIFAGTAVLIEWSLAFSKLKKYAKIIGIMVAIGFVYTLIAESVALNWRAWFYSNDKTFGIYVGGAALETFIFAVLVAIAISSATLIWSDYEERKKPLLKMTIEQIQDKLREWFKTMR